MHLFSQYDDHERNYKLKTEKERELHTKNVELRKNLEEAMWKISQLEKKNNTRQESDDCGLSSRSEQRIKDLKRRNGELVALAKKLEEKAKRLQQELGVLRSKDTGAKPNLDPNAEVDTLKRSFAMQRARDLAEQARVILTKDKVIANLKEKLQQSEVPIKNDEAEMAAKEIKISKLKEKIKELERTGNDETVLLAKDKEIDRLNKKLKQLQESGVTKPEKFKEMEDMVRQMAKEKLLLEKQLSLKNANMENTGNQELDNLKSHCKELKEKEKALEEKLQKSEVDNKELHKRNEELNEKANEFDLMAITLKERDEECEAMAKQLKEYGKEYRRIEDMLTDAEKKVTKLEEDKENSQHVIKVLQTKMTEMNTKLAEMKQYEEECRNLTERLHIAESQCSSMQNQVETLQNKINHFKKIEQDLKASQSKCMELEDNFRSANDELEKKEEEIYQLHKVQEEANRSHNETISALQEEIRHLETVCTNFKDNEKSLHDQLKALETKVRQKPSVISVHVQTSRPSSPLPRVNPVGKHSTDEEKIVPRGDLIVEVCNDAPQVALDLAPAEISTQGNDDELSYVSEPEPELSLRSESILDLASSKIAALAASSSEGEFSQVDNTDIDRLIPESTNVEKSPENIDYKPLMISVSTPTPKTDRNAQAEEQLPKIKLEDEGAFEDDLTLSLDASDLSFESDKEESQAMEFPTDDVTAHIQDKPATSERIPEAIDEQKLSVYAVKYTYDPYEHSPNDNPELELAIQAGEYIYVYGKADEDGFYTGELMNGQRGLVPSNFIKKLADEDDLEKPVTNGHVQDPLTETDDDDLTEAEYLRNKTEGVIGRGSSKEFEDAFDFDTSSLDGEAAEGMIGSDVPHPRKLTLERQLSTSIVVSWLQPEGIPNDHIKEYAVYADGKLKEIVDKSSRTKALITDIHSDKTYRISVRTVTTSGKESLDSKALLTVGKGATAAPIELKCNHVTAVSVEIEWVPGNSSYAHAIYLNGKEIQIVKPSIVNYLLQNLTPDTDYEVLIQARLAKEIKKIPRKSEEVSTRTSFRTLVGGVPDPPLNVQVQANVSSRHLAKHTDQNYLAIVWLPVTITSAGTSNGALVNGYKVYVNNICCAEVDSPTEDNVFVKSVLIKDALKEMAGKYSSVHLTVRTQSIQGESADSNSVELSTAILDQLVNNWQQTLRRLSVEEFQNECKSSSPEIPRTQTKEVEEINAEDKNSELSTKADFELIETRAANLSKIEDVRPINRSLGKPKVVLFNVDEDDDDDDESDSDSELEITTYQKLGEDEHKAVPEVAPKEEKEPEDRNGSPTSPAALHLDGIDLDQKLNEVLTPDISENLILPQVPVSKLKEHDPKYDNDPQATAQYLYPPNEQPPANYPISDESDLSAIEEETAEDLDEYHKDKLEAEDSHPNIPALTVTEFAPLQRASESDENATFTVSSIDANKRIYAKDDSINQNKESNSKTFTVSKSSKESLSFGSDDVIDLLDKDIEKDIVEQLPEFPHDSESSKNKGLLNSKPTKTVAPVKTVESETPANVAPVKDNSQSKPSAGHLENIQHGDIEKSNSNTSTKSLNNLFESIPNTQKKSTSDEFFVNFDDMNFETRTNEAEPFKDAFPADFVNKTPDTANTGNETLINTIHIAGSDGKKSETRSDADSIESQRQSSNSVNLKLNQSESVDIYSVNDEGDLDNEQKQDEVEDDDDSDYEPFQMPTTSMTDLYKLHAVDSFDDSVLNFETEDFIKDKRLDDISLNIEEKDKYPEIDVHELNTVFKSNNNTPANAVNNETQNASADLNVEPVTSHMESEVNSNSNNNSIQNKGIAVGSHVDLEASADLVPNVRIFIALFTYDPAIMSPNPDGVDEELAFTEGDFIKIYGDVDEDGFYFGEAHDKKGFIPGNMVQEVKLDYLGNGSDPNAPPTFSSFKIPPPPPADEEVSEESITQEPAEKQVFHTQDNSDKKSTNCRGDNKNNQKENTEDRRDSRSSQELTGSQRLSETDNKQQASKTDKRKKSSKAEDKEKFSKFDKTEQISKTSNKPSKEELLAARKSSKNMDDFIAGLQGIGLEDNDRNYRYISERDSIYCLPPRRMIALYDYDPSVSSPNVDSEPDINSNDDESRQNIFHMLSKKPIKLKIHTPPPAHVKVEIPFRSGEIILIFGDMDEDGFFAGQLDGQRGLVPSNFLKEAPERTDAEEIEIGAASPSTRDQRKFSGSSLGAASPMESPKTKKKKGIFSKGKKIFSKLKGK